MLWQQYFAIGALSVSPAYSAPQLKNAAGKTVPSSQALTCSNGVCCDQFGGCVLQEDLGDLSDLVVNKRGPILQLRNAQGKKVPSSQALTCTDGVCCDSSGGCVFQNDLGDLADRVVN